MIEDLEKILFTEEEIHRRIKEVAGEISSDYKAAIWSSLQCSKERSSS